MNPRSFLSISAAGGIIGAPPSPFQIEKSKQKITSVRLVNTRAKRPLQSYTPAPIAWSVNGVDVASPRSIYPGHNARRSLFLPDPGKVPIFTVEVATDKGVKGYGSRGPGEAYKRWEEDNHITRGPERIYTRPSDKAGFGWDFEVVT